MTRDQQIANLKRFDQVLLYHGFQPEARLAFIIGDTATCWKVSTCPEKNNKNYILVYKKNLEVRGRDVYVRTHVDLYNDEIYQKVASNRKKKYTQDYIANNICKCDDLATIETIHEILKTWELK